MTAEEINKMEAGEEIDALVATMVMGWKVHHRNTAHWMRAEDDVIDYRVMGWTCSPDRWSPSTYIAAAWQVMEKIKREGNPTSLYWEDGEWWVDDNYTHRMQAHAPTAPLAICRAALAVAESERKPT